MPTSQPINPGLAEGAGVEQAIQSVESLYRAVTGKDPAAGDGASAPIPVEMNPARFVEEQLGRLLALLESRLAAPSAPLWHPLLGVSEDDADLILRLDVPGVGRGDLEVHLAGGVLLVRGSRPPVAAGARVRLSEIPQGSFSRQVLLPPGQRLGPPRAHLQDGVLEIRFARESAADSSPTVVQVN